MPKKTAEKITAWAALITGLATLISAVAGFWPFEKERKSTEKIAITQTNDSGSNNAAGRDLIQPGRDYVQNQTNVFGDTTSRKINSSNPRNPIHKSQQGKNNFDGGSGNTYQGDVKVGDTYVQSPLPRKMTDASLKKSLTGFKLNDSTSFQFRFIGTPNSEQLLFMENIIEALRRLGYQKIDSSPKSLLSNMPPAHSEFAHDTINNVVEFLITAQ